MSPETRSKVMARIRGKDTGPERLLRSLLHARGLRFRKNVRTLPGTPDVVFGKAKVAIFVDGDFWHGWRLDEWEAKLRPQWAEKLCRNVARDQVVRGELRRTGWKVIRVWEHDLVRDPEGWAARIEAIIRDGTLRSGPSHHPGGPH